jgi:Neuraminidase (sialidase)
MKEDKKNLAPVLDRRKFLNIAGIAATAGILPLPASAEVISENAPALVPPLSNDIAEIIESKTICVEPGKYLGQGTEYALNTNGHVVVKARVIEPNRYIGWPTIMKTREGKLMVAFSGDRDAHVCPYGKTQVVTSDNNGKTWSAPETITSTPLDDRDAGLIQTKKGTLVVSWFTSLAFERPGYEAAYNKYVRIGEKIDKVTKDKWLGNWVRRSEDQGKTWLEPSRTKVTAPHGPISLANGDLLYIGTSIENGKPRILAERSADDGKTWKVQAEIPQHEDFTVGLSEPHVVQLRSGKIIAMVRNEPKDRDKCFLLQSESTDGGKTWSKMRSTGIWGYPPHVIQLKNDWLLVVYGVRRAPFGERACISKDGGKTWDIANEVNLLNADSQDLGYPSSVQLDDGSILTAFYQAPKFGEPTVLMTTHWRLK